MSTKESSSAAAHGYAAWRREPPDRPGKWWMGWLTKKGKWCVALEIVTEGKLANLTWPEGWYAAFGPDQKTPPAMPHSDKSSDRP